MSWGRFLKDLMHSIKILLIIIRVSAVRYLDNACAVLLILLGLAGGNDDLPIGKSAKHEAAAAAIKLGKHVIKEVNGVFSRNFLCDLALGKLQCQNA